VRDAAEADLPAILDIYNASIATTSTWADEPQTLDDRCRWFAERQRNGDAVLVADDGDVAGFTAYGPFRDNELWPGYRFTVELTIHVRHDRQGRGIGVELLRALERRAADAGMHAMIAAVDSENSGALRFYEREGYVEVGRLPETGWKFGRWLTLVLLQRTL